MPGVARQLAFAFVCAASLACTPGDRSGPQAYATKDLEGRHVALHDFRGEVVLLNFWATWCEPCKRELPELARLHEELGSRGFSVVAVSVDGPRDEDAVRELVAELDLPFPVWLDPTNHATPIFALRGYPTTFVLDRGGKATWRRDGIIEVRDPELAATLEAALADP